MNAVHSTQYKQQDIWIGEEEDREAIDRNFVTTDNIVTVQQT